MNDILPEQTPVWQYLESRARQIFRRYGYQEIRLPIVEQTELFKRSIGEVTDIVEKEMYTFDDRNGDSLTLRPEGTAGCVRAAEEHGLIYNQTRKLWYAGPMFRHERPQKGRYRQFHQMGVECFGMLGPDIDAELLVMTARLWQELGLTEHVRLQINSLGSAADRGRYRAALVDYLNARIDLLDDDSRRRLSTNPLRVLDSKEPGTQALLKDAPTLADYLDEDAIAHFAGLRRLLDAAGIAYEINPRLVRGLDYYGKTVFEWVTDSLGAQGTVCAGGRYDGLIEQLGGKPAPGVGFAMGIERLVLLLEAAGVVPASANGDADIYLVVGSDAVLPQAFTLAEEVRAAWPDKVVMVHCGGGSFKSQLKKADRSGASLALVLGDDEWARGEMVLKPLRTEQPQTSIPLLQLMDALKSWLV